MVTSLPAAGGGVKGKRSECSGRRGTKAKNRNLPAGCIHTTPTGGKKYPGSCEPGYHFVERKN